jgi:hypothetical protein
MFYIHLRNKIAAAVYEIEIFLPDSSLCIFCDYLKFVYL